MSAPKEVFMEDINTWCQVICDKIQKDTGINDMEQDIIWDKISAELQEHFKYPDYRNYN